MCDSSGSDLRGMLKSINQCSYGNLVRYGCCRKMETGVPYCTVRYWAGLGRTGLGAVHTYAGIKHE